jgi:hypothetical protein
MIVSAAYTTFVQGNEHVATACGTS